MDERPENLVPSEPRRFRERSHDGPLSLPLPRFAAQMLNNNNNSNNTGSSNNSGSGNNRSSNASLAKVASPPCANLSMAPSPRTAPQPPASPPPRHPSPSPTSSDSETAPQSPSLEERIRSLDEKYEKWSGSRALSAAGGDALAKLDATASERFRFRHKLLDLDLHEVQPSDIVKSVLAKRSVFDEDSKRLENFSEKYEPREFTGVIGVSSMIGSTGGPTSSSGCTSKVCLQYPFPSHPPVQLTSSASVTSQIGISTSSLSSSLTFTSTMSSALKTADPRAMGQHNCVHPTPATPITPGTTIKTVSPELPPVSLPIGLGSGTTASSGNGSGLASASSILSSNGSVSSIHVLGASTTRGLCSNGSPATFTTSTPVTTTSTLTFSTPMSTSSVAITSTTTTTLATTASTASVTTTTSSTISSSSSLTTSGQYPTSIPTVSSVLPSSTTSSNSSSSSSTSSSSSSLSSSADSSRSRPRKEVSSSNREGRESRDSKDSRDSRDTKDSRELRDTKESRESRDSKDSKDSKYSVKGKDCQRKSRKEDVDVERSRKDREEKDCSSMVNDVADNDGHAREFKENKEMRYERKEREEKERKEKDDRERQERREKEDRDRQERKEREERREKDEERRERERLDKERQEKDKREREERERERERDRERERERKEREENEAKEKERREKERLEREKREREEKERQERREREDRERREREDRERKERELRLERERQEKERLRKEREEQERREKEERDRLERERRREEKERLERERKREREEKERLERERRKEKEERERAERTEKEKREKEEREKVEREKHDREKRREREDQERREKEKTERDKRRDREEKDKEKRDRDDSRRQPTENHLHQSISQSQNQIAPAPVPIKRRCSSQDGPTEDDSKRMKITEHRRDSKDRPRQNRRSEDRKHRNESHRSSRESRESRDSKDSSGSTQMQDSREQVHIELNRESMRENRENNRDSGKDKQRSKRNRSEKESRERSPRVSHEPDKEFLSRLDLSKRNDSNSPSEQNTISSNHSREMQQHHQQQSSLNLHSDVDDGPLSTHDMQVTRHPSATDTDSDEPKKHSIFDIVDDEPAYISMYDKVKARSTKNMQKLEEEKRQVRLKDKFSQLKQSRARREEKKQSTSWDGDSVSSKALTEDEATSESDSARAKSLSRKSSRSRIHSDTSEEDESFNNKIRKAVKTERFLESDVDLGFADTEEKHNPLESSNMIVNSVHVTVKEEPRTSDDDERISVPFRGNHPTMVMNNHERDSRKKSHKKKQKRQKNSLTNDDSLKSESSESTEHKNKSIITVGNAESRPNHTLESLAVTTTTASGITTLENTEDRIRSDKKQRNKKDKRRDRNGDDKAKARRKRLNRQEARDTQRMEDIFGPLSDDVDDGPSNTFFNRLGNITSENTTYASDSDGGHSPVLDVERARRKAEKKRRHHPEDENSVDLAEAGREIEANLLRLPSSPKSGVVCTENNDHDVFRFTDDNDSVEPSTPSAIPEKVKEKKKKRKKSKEERSRKDYHHHHHHHHHHHEKSGELPYLGADPSPPRASSPLVPKSVSPTLPTPRDTLLSPIPKVTSNVAPVPPMTPPVVSGSIQPSKPEKKKDKFIPGFGIEIDETIHENAVKSISEPEERENTSSSRNSREEPEVTAPTTPPTQTEDKPRVAISQEETEDAVAALLEETFGGSTEDFSYEGEEEDAETEDTVGAPTEAPQEDVEEMQQAVESLNASTGEGEADMKPDTPQSEHDLQIDTDTEEDPNYESFDLTQPPKTPDIPSFYKSPTKTVNTVTPSLAATEKPIETRIPSIPVKPQNPPTSVIAHSWNLNEKPREVVKPVQPVETLETNVTAASPERVPPQAHRTSTTPPPQYKQPVLGPCSVPITSETPRIAPVSPRPPPISVQSLYQKLPVSPQSQMVPMRQTSPRMQNISTVSTPASSNQTPLPPLVPSRMPPLVPSQLSPRILPPTSPNGQWSRNSALSPHMANVRKPSPPPARIAVSVSVSAHRPETPSQQIYSTAATQQPVIQHAPGMRALAPSHPRGGLPPLTLNIPHRPYMPVPPLTPGVQVKNSRDSALGGKSVIETLLPVNPNDPPQRLEETKLSPAVIPEATNKASTSPKVPSPNQPPTYIPETAKIEVNASTSSPVFGKPSNMADTCSLSTRNQKQIASSITTDNNLLSPRQKQEISSLQLLTTHVPRSSTPSPVIVAHGQSHLVHKSVVHSISASTVSAANQPLVKTVVPIVSQQIASTVAVSLPEEKCIIAQTALPLSSSQRHSPVSQASQMPKPHIPLVSTVSQAIISRTVPSTISTVSPLPVNEQSTPEVLETAVPPEQELELDADVQMAQTAQPMQLTPPIQPSQPMDIIKDEPPDDVKHEETSVKEELPSPEPENQLNQQVTQPCTDEITKSPKVEQQQDLVKSEKLPFEPKSEPTDSNIVPKIEVEVPIKSEPVADDEVKEEETVKENEEADMEEEPTGDPLKEPTTDPLAIDVTKEDPADSKEDSDYWSAKEVNIESVIKKVDALCDGEGNDGDEETQNGQNTSNETHEQSKNSESEWFNAEAIEAENKKNFAVNEDQDEGVETCESESTKSRRGRTKNRRGVSSRGGVSTRRSSRNTTAVVNKRGNRTPRGSKHHVEKNKLPADVYEFHDDSEEDNAGRPRLILTIKSPVPNLTGPNAQPATPIAAVKEVPPEEFVSPAANTRKSRRLAERDGSRNTIDDIIEDVVRGSAANKGVVGGSTGNVHATRRSTRHNNSPRNVLNTVQLTEPRKSPRAGRKSIRRTSENTDDSSEEKIKETPVAVPELQNKEESIPPRDETPKVEETSPPVSSPTQKPVSHEPMTLIDPVTGMLIPMRESEEGQYIPVSTASGQAQMANRVACDTRNTPVGMVNTTPNTTEVLRPKPPQPENLSITEEPKKEQPPEPVPTQQIQPQTSVITKPQSPVSQVAPTISIVPPATTSAIVTSIAPTAIATPQTAPICTTPSKPTSLKAHVLNASKLATPAQQQIVITKPAAPSVPSQSVVQNMVKPTQAVQGLHLQIPSNSSNRVVSPSLSPRAKQTPQINATNGKGQGQPMSPVLNNIGVPPNPKQHLLQAAKQQTSTIVNLPQKLPMNVHPANVTREPTPRIHQPVSQPAALKVINGQPHPLNPKAHLLQAVVPPIVAGAVASPPTQPHLLNPQPAGVSCSRPPAPKPPVRIVFNMDSVLVVRNRHFAYF